MNRYEWLLDIVIDGRPYRYVVGEPLEVSDRDAVRIYRAGLADLELAAGDDDVRVTIRDESVDWPSLAAPLEAAPAELRRIRVGAELGTAETYVSGEARGVAHGTRSEAVSFTIRQGRAAESGLGVQLPDPLAKIDEHTWPIHTATLGEAGAVYPIVFGSPGHTGSGDPEPVMPIAMAQWTVLQPPPIYAVVGEDGPNMQATSVFVRNDTRDSETNEVVSVVTDLLGRRVAVATLTGNRRPTSATEAPRLFCGFGGSHRGVARTAYEVIRYLLERWAPSSADWPRLNALADDLAIYQVDTWIDAPVSDPWAWISSTLVPDLPFEVRQGRRGRFLEPLRWTPTGRWVARSLTAGAGVERLTPWTRDDAGPVNEFTGLYRRSVSDEWLGRVVLTGRPEQVGGALTGVAAPSGTTGQRVVVQNDQRCQRSFSRFGLRQAQPVEIDWTWDTGTVSAILSWRAERDAVPDWSAEYSVRMGFELSEGDEILLTDDELGLSEALCLVDAAPIADRTDWATISLRRPAE